MTGTFQRTPTRGWPLALLLALPLIACSGDTIETQPESLGEDALTRAIVPGVVGIQILRTNTASGKRSDFPLGVPRKVRRFLDGLKRTPTRCPTGFDCVARCEQDNLGLPPETTRFIFFDKAGAEIAQGELSCGRGWIQRGDAAREPVTVRANALAVLDEPLVPADALWGLERAGVIGFPESPSGISITARARISSLVGATKPNDEMNGLEVTRCAPYEGRYPYWHQRLVNFVRDGRIVAQLGFGCDEREERIHGTNGIIRPGQRSIAADFRILASKGVPSPTGGAVLDYPPIANGTLNLDLRSIQRVVDDTD